MYICSNDLRSDRRSFERVEKVDTLLDGMPLARKSKIFGLRSIPANTTPVSLKNRYILRFFAYKCFSAAHVSGKTENAV